MFHVPSFFFISFFFLFPIIKGKNIKKMALRLKRLSIPYFYWPLIAWSLNNLFCLLYGKSIFGYFISFKHLFKQFVIGRIFFWQFWFLFNLLFLTILFFILSLILKMNYFLVVLQLFTIISYILQYSKYNYFFFDNYKIGISHSLGHLVESFPIAVTAFILSLSGFMNIFTLYRKVTIIYCIIINFFIYKYNIFKTIEYYGHKYHYNGFDKNIFSILSFIIFYLIRFENIKSNQLKIIINIITSYTQGIYCLHVFIFIYATQFLHLKGSFKDCIIIYLISYLTSFIGAKICKKNKLKFLFI